MSAEAAFTGFKVSFFQAGGRRSGPKGDKEEHILIRPLWWKHNWGRRRLLGHSDTTTMAEDDCNITLAAVLGEQPPLGPRAGWSTISILITLDFCWPALRTKVCAAFFLPLTQAPARRIANSRLCAKVFPAVIWSLDNLFSWEIMFFILFSEARYQSLLGFKTKRNEH